MIDPPTSSLLASDVEDTCGAEYCPQETYFYNETLFLPTLPIVTAKMLLSVSLGLAILGFGISCAFLDSRIKEPRSFNDRTSIDAHLKSVKHAFQDPKLQLAAPLTLFIGLEQGFIFGDFTEVRYSILKRIYRIFQSSKKLCFNVFFFF